MVVSSQLTTTKVFRFILILSHSRGNPLTFEFGLSSFKDTQLIHLQEMPERAPAGQLPRSVMVYVENDLVDVIKPGDRVRIYGVYRAIAQEPQGIGLARSSSSFSFSLAFIIR